MSELPQAGRRVRRPPSRIGRNEQKRRARAYERQLRAEKIAKRNEGRALHRQVRTPKTNLGPVMQLLADRRLRQKGLR